MLNHPQFTVSSRACHSSVPSLIRDLPSQACFLHMLGPYSALSLNGARFPHLCCCITCPWQYIDETQQHSWARGTRIQHSPWIPNPNYRGVLGPSRVAVSRRSGANTDKNGVSVRHLAVSNLVLGARFAVGRSLIRVFSTRQWLRG
jgi:hypothetical protein